MDAQLKQQDHRTRFRRAAWPGIMPGLLLGLLLTGMVYAAGCASAKKDAADAAIATSTDAFVGMRAEAEEYAPLQAASVQRSLQSARGSLAGGDYSRALAVAKDIPSEIQELGATIKDRKDELRDQWEELSATVPGLLRAAQSRIDALSRAHRITTDAREVLGVANTHWRRAGSSYNADELLLAVSEANSTRDMLSGLLAGLNTRQGK